MSKKKNGNDLPPPNDAYGSEGQEAMEKFKKKWETWSPEQKADTLLNMVLGIGYRMDILASVVSGIPDVEKMEKEAKQQAAVDLAKRKL